MGDDVTGRVVQAGPEARARQAAVAAQLTMSGEITPERLQNQDVTTAAIEDGWIHGSFDVDVMD